MIPLCRICKAETTEGSNVCLDCFRRLEDNGFVARLPDWSYSEDCGCKVTFIGESGYRTSRMLPGPTCKDHTGRDQMAERDCLIDRARKALASRPESS